ncbi:MAG TPA: hypothetical protein VJB57_19155 [Dehalococcoidia bacterium]|nr:hypothetical protein [Dehalococcoidia bacterium]
MKVMNSSLSEVLLGSREEAQADHAKDVEELLPLVLRPFVPSERLCSAVYDILDIPLMDIAKTGFDKFQAIAKAKAATKGKPTAVQKVPIYDRTLRSTLQPRIEIEVEGRGAFTIPLDIALALTIEAITVTVTAGSISDVGPGDAIAEASLKVKGLTIVPTRRVRVPLLAA